MEIYFSVCASNIHISLNNYTLSKYIKNRYVGFITDKTNSAGLTIVEVSREVLINKYGFSFLKDNKGALLCQSIDRLYVNYVSDFAVILYDKRLNVCYVCLGDNVSDNYIHLVGVQVCNIITEYLIQNKIYCIHSSAVTFNKSKDNGILFIGESGAGKTSLAYEFLRKGEQITNDDVAFIRLKNNNLYAYQNTQYIGLDDDSISKLYPECAKYIVKKDGLTLDKNRVDLLKMNRNAFATEIIIKKIVIIDRNRNDTASLNTLDSVSAYGILFKAAAPFLPKDILINPNIVDIIVDKHLPVYRLTPVNTAQETVSFLYDKFKEL